MPITKDYDPKRCCDAHYECSCREQFKVYTSMTGSRFLPESFETKPMSEVKQAEQDAITENIINPK